MSSCTTPVWLATEPITRSLSELWRAFVLGGGDHHWGRTSVNHGSSSFMALEHLTTAQLVNYLASPGTHGTIVETYPDTTTSGRWLAIDPDGALWFACGLLVGETFVPKLAVSPPGGPITYIDIPHAELPSGGAWDLENDRLIYATGWGRIYAYDGGFTEMRAMSWDYGDPELNPPVNVVHHGATFAVFADDGGFGDAHLVATRVDDWEVTADPVVDGAVVWALVPNCDGSGVRVAQVQTGTEFVVTAGGFATDDCLLGGVPAAGAETVSFVPTGLELPLIAQGNVDSIRLVVCGAAGWYIDQLAMS